MAGLSVREAADAVGLKPGTVHSWETDAEWRRLPDAEPLGRLLDLYAGRIRTRAFAMRGAGGKDPDPPAAVEAEAA